MKTKNKTLFLLKIGIIFTLLMTLFMCRDVKAETFNTSGYGKKVVLPQGTNRTFTATYRSVDGCGTYDGHHHVQGSFAAYNIHDEQVAYQSGAASPDCSYESSNYKDSSGSGTIPDSAVYVILNGGYAGYSVKNHDIQVYYSRQSTYPAQVLSLNINYTPFTPTKELIIKGTLKTSATKGSVAIDETTPFTIVLKDTSYDWYEVTSTSNSSVNASSSSMDITTEFTTSNIENTENAIILNGTLTTNHSVTGVDTPITKSSSFSLEIDKTTGDYVLQGGTTKFIAESEDDPGHLATMTVASVNDKYGNIIEFQGPRIDSNLTYIFTYLHCVWCKSIKC